MKYKRSQKVDEDFSSSHKFAKGDQILMAEMAIEEKFTQPPAKMSESNLLKLMEEYGIGTDASMASHIDNIIKISISSSTITTTSCITSTSGVVRS